MKSIILLIFGSLISQSLALSCLSRTTGTTSEVCKDDQNYGPAICKVSWKVNSTTLTYDITARGCEYGMGEVNGTCTFGSGSGTCYCNGDKCNDQPAAWGDDANRRKCHYCQSGDCTYSDLQSSPADFGREIKCPIGITRCSVTKDDSGNHRRFYRDCDWSSSDVQNEYDNMGGCNEDGCTCGADKCNTGFHGKKCHSYEESTCNGGTSSNGGVIECLTGTEYCAVGTVEHPDADCQTTFYGCAVGRTEAGCETLEKYGYLGEAELCYCQSKDLCDPRGGGASGLFAFSASLLVFLAFLIAK